MITLARPLQQRRGHHQQISFFQLLTCSRIIQYILWTICTKQIWRKMLKRMNTAMSIRILINNKWRHNNRNMWSQNNKGIQTNWEVNHLNCFYILFYEDCPLMWMLKKGDNLWFCVHDALHKCALRRFPYEIRRFQFVIDRHHQANHTACSEAYSMSCYPYMNNMNIQLAEQLNNSLRKLSTVTAYSKVNTYIKILEAFITVKNLCVKNIIWRIIFNLKIVQTMVKCVYCPS